MPSPHDAHDLLAAAPAMLLSTRPDGRADYANPAWRAFTGRASSDELDQGWREGVHPDDRRSLDEVFGPRGKTPRGEPFEIELRLRDGEGRYHHVRLRGAPRVADGRLLGFVIAGEPLDAAHAIASDREIFARLLDHLCVAGFDGYWKRLNPSWTRTLGFTEEELMSRPLIEFVHPDDREATLQARSGLKRGQPLMALTNRYRRRDGSYCWFEWRSVSDVEREIVYASARDVTEEHGVRRELAELTASLAATLDSIADGLLSTDAAGRVTRMNPVAETLTGWPASEAVGRPLAEIFVIVDETGRPASLHGDRTLEEDLASQSREHVLLVARDRSERPIAYSRAPLRAADGEVSGTVIVFRDMTAEHQARREREQLQRQLMLTDRLSSVGTLAAGVAHEINNPLAAVMANLDFMLEDFRTLERGGSPPSERLTEWMTMVEEARGGAERIRRVVRGLATFSRAEEERQTHLDPRAVIDLAVELAFNEIRHRARLVKEYGDVPLVEGDASRLGQVFINLLVNAAQAIGEGDVEHNAIEVVTRTDSAGNAVVEVNDTGPGFSAESRDRVFDPFFTTKAVGVGTGLGLAICHAIVTGMNGTITAENRSPRGARLCVTLPPASVRVPAASASAPVPGLPETPPSRAPLAVLVVDDERAVATAVRRILREHDVTALFSAKDALALIEAGHRFDVIVSDLMMPEMSGMEFFAALSRDHASLADRVVFITGGAFTSAAHTFLDRVENPRLEKPFEPAALQALVERVGARAS